MDNEIRRSLIELHSASFGWAMVCCRGQRELAEDVLQSVYVQVLDRPAKFDGRSTFRTWLFAVIRNVAAGQLRRRWWSGVLRLEAETLAELDGTTTDPDTMLDQNEEAAMIRQALSCLPERQRELTHLVFYEDLSVADAAEVMGVSVGTARQHYARAKTALSAVLRPLLKSEFVSGSPSSTTKGKAHE